MAVLARLKVKLPTAGSAGRDHRQAFRPKIRPTPPGGASASRSAGWFRYTLHTHVCLAEAKPTYMDIMHENPSPTSPPNPTPTSPPTPTALPTFFGSLHSRRGPAPAPLLNKKTPAVATDHLVCAPPCVCTTLCMHRLVYAPPCGCTTLCVDSQNFPLARFAEQTPRFAKCGGQPPHPP